MASEELWHAARALLRLNGGGVWSPRGRCSTYPGPSPHRRARVHYNPAHIHRYWTYKDRGQFVIDIRMLGNVEHTFRYDDEDTRDEDQLILDALIASQGF